MGDEPQWVYGLHAVAALVDHACDEILVLRIQRERHDQRIRELRTQARAAGIRVEEVASSDLDATTAGGRHQGIAALRQVRAAHDEVWLFKHLQTATAAPLLLILDGVQDPRNLGACIRSADAAGVVAVIAPRDRATGLSPSARKTASGAAERVPFIQVTNLARTLREIKQHGVWITGADSDAKEVVYDADLNGPLAIVVGGEGKGLRRLTREHCDRLVRIPMRQGAQSLNLSVAAGILLFEALRQRG